MKVDGIEQTIVRCECGSLDHIVELSVHSPYEHMPTAEAYLTFHLKTWRPWWKRIAYALRYVLGLRQRYGAWDEMVIDREAAGQMHAALAAYLLMLDHPFEEAK